ncbi:MAG: aspartate kinase, partial [Bacteroidia bacterium]|nr:aspartate kinase [Bacteroidia bacterium]
SGTLISYENVRLAVPSFIFRINQTLIVISPKDFSFIIEENLRDVFHIFASCGVKINVMQNTAISFSVSVDYDESKIPVLIEKLKEKFNVSYENHALELITIRNYDQQTIDRVCVMKEILLEQKTKTTAQLVVRKLD